MEESKLWKIFFGEVVFCQLFAIFSELTAWCHNLIYGVPKVASSVISPLFLKIWKAIFRKDSLLLEAKHFAPQPFSRCTPSNSST